MNYTRLICSTLTYIETHLAESLTLSMLAERAKCSPYHFHRTFSASTGWPPASYVRARRMTRAANQVLETNHTIMRIAVDQGFDSQAAFARAFKKYFGISPTQLKRRGTLIGLPTCMPLTASDLEHLVKEAITMEPTIIQREAFDVVGLSTTFTPEDTSELGALWQTFMPTAHAIKGRVDYARSFGVNICEGPHFRYVASVEIAPEAETPEGMERVHIPAQHYAVFTHKGTIDTLPQTMHYIFATWINNTSHKTLDAPEFELYDERYIPNSAESAFDIYVPIEAPEANN